MRTAALVAVTGSLLLAGTATAPAAPTPGAEARARGTALAAERAAAEGIRFGPCPDRLHLEPPAECGTVRVPLDYARPDGERIALTVSRARASGVDAQGRPVPRQGSLVLRTGTPGSSGVYVPTAAGLGAWQRVHAAYDLVGYTPRGVGEAAPLSCQDPARFAAAPTAAPRHPDRAYTDRRRQEARAYARGCLRGAGARLRHYSTRDNARDLDVIRAALGERRLSYLGIGYGAQLGAVYATLFPGHVRRMVFDSAPDPAPERAGYPNLLRRTAAFERRWRDFLGWVARHHDSYRLGRDAAAVRRTYEAVRTELGRRPAGGRVGPGQLQAAFAKAVHYDDYWPLRAEALAAFRRGEPDFLIQQASPVAEVATERENAAAVATAVHCNDARWPRSWATWERDARRLARSAPFAAWDHVWDQLPCASWPLPGQRPVDVRAERVPPTLVLAAERDAVAPYEGARELRRRIAGAVLVTERGAGSTGLAGGENDCVNGHLDRYLVDGEVPARDAFCAPHPEPRPLAAGGRAAVDRVE